ncbi:MAG: TlyA family rRNA (cytidine-2'-O)-methyltransferase [Sulfobacillus acidophilus]|uniref:TlyA family rRNA (Cytidine-2'-O)-methyltransferase n=1 Tax=Sulfobacillus acidophilus TaxID=53633 RepID=A0A2T2WPN6_9FIRM|nr:MAG: TlyA family rRNA (cytidine-2'-O)-methyltransferase [Sulfobacillus acidophilus]
MAETRTRAQAAIMAGRVLVNGRLENKSGRSVKASDVVSLVQPQPFVSRGGLKLDFALREFGLEVSGWSVVDIGASTGGFTDCWLKHGVERVYAVDVGYGQLHWRLRQDERVVVMERTNARYLTLEALGGAGALDGASIDASFIGLRLLLTPLLGIMRPGGTIVALVKPQFEAGPKKVGKGGVVRHPHIHEEVLHKVIGEARELGYGVQGITVSPIRGAQGNVEFLLCLVAHSGCQAPIDIPAVVADAWKGGDTDG